MIQTLVSLVIWIIIIGLLLWLLRYVISIIPMDPTFKQFANVVVIVIGVLCLIGLLLGLMGAVPFPRFM